MGGLLSTENIIKNRIDRELTFQVLSSQSVDLIQLLEQFIINNIQPIYGDQSYFLKKVREGKDRACEFLLHRAVPVGFIIYKTSPSNEFAAYGVKNGLELKTTVLLQKNTKMTGVFLRHLLGRAARRAVEINADCFFGTISAKKQDVLRVMCKFGADVVKTFNGKYLDNVDEHLICHQNPMDLWI